ncbi:MAG: uracil phosphoribosyltransferase [Bacteroidetes bacterium]|jgi:uracil phosphoribosyltransferase|nr:uracil phosphoribosyltransferase [Bacteroidota bacterium]
MIHILSEQNSIFNQYIAELRDITIQKDSMRFRRNLERIGEIMSYEISKTMEYVKKETTTPLGIAETSHLAEQPVIATILRAGLPMHIGVLNYFDSAENAFISAYRRHHKDNSFDIHVEYVSSPNLDGKTLILCDPMIATGGSIVLAYKAILAKGTPKHVHIISAISSKEGVDFVRANLPTKDFTIWCGAIDEELTAHSYIVPGLGDAGDLAFGEKI